jgi:hypothetical protein
MTRLARALLPRTLRIKTDQAVILHKQDRAQLTNLILARLLWGHRTEIWRENRMRIVKFAIQPWQAA